MEDIAYTHELISDACLAAEEGDFERIEKLRRVLGGWMTDENERNALEDMLDKMGELAEFVAAESDEE